MSNNENSVDILLEKVKKYSKTTIELFKLKAIEKTANAASTLAMQLVLLGIIVLFSLSINIAIALWIGELLGKSYYGFFVMTGFYAIVFLLAYACRIQYIKSPLQNTIIKEMLQEKIHEKL